MMQRRPSVRKWWKSVEVGGHLGYVGRRWNSALRMRRAVLNCRARRAHMARICWTHQQQSTQHSTQHSIVQYGTVNHSEV